MSRFGFRRWSYGLLAACLMSSALVAQTGTPAAAAVDAVGTARCKLRGSVAFSPPITNTPKNGVTWSLQGALACTVATTGMDRVMAKTGIIQARSNPGTFSCSTTAYPAIALRILWTTNTGAALNPTYINWTNPTSALPASSGARFNPGAGQVTGSYGGQNNWLRLVGRKIPVGDCATSTGLAGYKVARRDNPAAVYAGTCSNGQVAPAGYDHVVVFQFQNRRWDDVGLGFTGMPYLHSLASSCNYFREWTEADTTQGSMVQNIAQMTGAVSPNAAQNCLPSATCFSTANSIFRQLRTAGRTAVNYVEGTAQPCSPAAGFLPGFSWPHWVPYLYFTGADDRAFCNVHVRPYSEFNPNALPAFSFITPTECNNGHFPGPACGNATVDNWARANISRVINTADYRAGRVAIFVWYDQYAPVPNLQIAPTAQAGVNNLRGHGFGSTLRAWQGMLGLPCLGRACFSPNLRIAAGL